MALHAQMMGNDLACMHDGELLLLCFPCMSDGEFFACMSDVELFCFICTSGGEWLCLL